MKKEDLRSGMIITDRDGNEYIVFLNTKKHEDIFVGIKDRCWGELNNYKSDLTNVSSKNLDIMKVEEISVVYLTNPYKSPTRKLLWERKEPKEMTVAEIEKILGYSIKIVK